MDLVNAGTRRRLASLHPQVAEEIARLEQALDDTSLDPQLLALAAAYFDAALRDASWTPPRPLSDLESDYLALCEQFMVAVSQVSDDQVAALARHMGADELYNLMYAIYLIEMAKRLDITLEQVLP